MNPACLELPEVLVPRGRLDPRGQLVLPGHKAPVVQQAPLVFPVSLPLILEQEVLCTYDGDEQNVLPQRHWFTQVGDSYIFDNKTDSALFMCKGRVKLYFFSYIIPETDTKKLKEEYAIH